MKIENRCKKIKIVLTDVDGVLTDGGLYYTKDGDVMKRFHVRDGMGVTLLRDYINGYKVGKKNESCETLRWYKTERTND